MGGLVSQKEVNPYFKTRVLTASPEELHLMLYDGAIKFAGQAREAIAGGDIERSYNLLVRSQNIVLELLNGLKRDLAPEVCNKQAALYNFIYRRLVDANLHKDTAALDDAIKILNYCRETWTLVIDKLAEQKGVAPKSTATENGEQKLEPVSIDLEG